MHEVLYERVHVRAAADGVLHEVHGGVDADGVARVDARAVLVVEVAVYLHRLVETGLRPDLGKQMGFIGVDEEKLRVIKRTISTTRHVL